MIDSIRLENFKNHKETHVELAPLTAFAGPNSSGKSTILEAIRLISRIGRGDGRTLEYLLSESLNPAHLVRRGCSSVSVHVNGSLSDHPEPDRWSVSVTATRTEQSIDDDDFKLSIKAKCGEWTEHTQEANTALFDRRRDDAPPTAFLNFVYGIQYVRALGHVVGKASYTKDLPARIGERGENLASVIAHYRLREPDKIRELTKQVCQIIPSITDIKVEQKLGQIARGSIVRVLDSKRESNTGDFEIVYQLLFDTTGGPNIVAEHMSEGTLITTALLTALIDSDSSDGPQTLLIDDIDQGLHPKAQRDLVGLLRRIQKERKDLQVIFTTHSPYVIDEMEAEEVILLNTDVNGIAHAKKLSEHPDAEHALQVLTTGEFWSAEGEDWVVSGDGATDDSSTPASSPSDTSDDA